MQISTNTLARPDGETCMCVFEEQRNLHLHHLSLLLFFPFSTSLLPPVLPSCSLPPLLFPEVLCSPCCCVITADALAALFFPSFLLPLFLPLTTLLFVHLMPLCPCPKAPWAGGREQKQKAGLLAWRSGHRPAPEMLKGHRVL